MTHSTEAESASTPEARIAVAIGQDHHVEFPQRGERGPDRVALALLGDLEHPHPQPARDRAGAVGRVVVEDHDLGTRQGRAELRDHDADRGRLVEARDRDGNPDVVGRRLVRVGDGHGDGLRLLKVVDAPVPVCVRPAEPALLGEPDGLVDHEGSHQVRPGVGSAVEGHADQECALALG